ncbi:MAG: 30S ribosomal protein S2 [Candidatus Buchananbacteria bacterium]|nr:30S ribosomal protein S2 [Candidatus Buchananbacteria bacterium]
MPEIPDLLTMLKSGVHFGHQLSRWNPKMKPYIYGQKHGFHIINLEETQTKLKEALDFVTKVVANGGTILFLATKKQAQKIITTAANDCGMPYVTERWIGGTLTNFSAVNKVVRRFTELKQQKASGQLAKYTKKEQAEFQRDIEKLEKMVGGIESMTKIPDAVFVCDVKKEKTGVLEAIKKNIPIVAMCDTNADLYKVTYAIPANDDATKSIALITDLVKEAIQEGLKLREQKQVKPTPVKPIKQDKK